MHQIELMNLYAGTSGLLPFEGTMSHHDFQDRVEAAANAGFCGIGLWHSDLEHIMCHRSLREMKAILDDNGIKYLELEFLTDWFADGVRRMESDGIKRRLFQASEALGAKHIKIGDFYQSHCPMDLAVESFAKLCDDANDYGATIGFEFMPVSMLNNLNDALAMTELADRKNGGIILDMVHFVNLGISHDMLRKIPVKRLVNVELNDGARPESPLYDPERERRFCGEGDYDIKGFIRCLQEIGYQGPWAVEVYSNELAKLPLGMLNRKAFETTMNQFENR